MSNYKYKGINISTITNPISYNSNNLFKGFPTGENPHGNLYNPYPFGYKDVNGNLSNLCKAATETWFGGGVISIAPPSGCKSFRYIMIGGGGGGGGGGGHAHVGSNTLKNSANANGGDGYPGGNAKYLYSTSDVKVNSGLIEVFIGKGGAGSPPGQNANINQNANQNAYCKGGQGGGNTKDATTGPPPYNGTPTYFTYANVKSEEAIGADAGGFGNGGKAAMTTSGDKSTTRDGNSNDTSPNPATQSIDNNLGDKLANYGVGGNGGLGSTKGNELAGNGNNGIDGCAQFIWLYE
jgi:hypothetical protein